MAQPHKYAALIHAWADGAQIEYRPYCNGGHSNRWNSIQNPNWRDDMEYRIKPKIVMRFAPVFRMPAGSIYMAEAKYLASLARDPDFNGKREGDILVGVLRVEFHPDTMAMIASEMEAP